MSGGNDDVGNGVKIAGKQGQAGMKSTGKGFGAMVFKNGVWWYDDKQPPGGGGVS